MNPSDAADAFRFFVSVIKQLRTPGTGCPWDLEQTHQTLRPFLIEEAYEVLETIDCGDDDALREELGDLLLQVVLHAQLADDRGAFNIKDVIEGIERKMVRRHPHVFGALPVEGSAEVVRNWDQIKAAESAEKGKDTSLAGSMERLPPAMPVLQRAQRLGEKAVKGGAGEVAVEALFARLRESLIGLEQNAEQRAIAETKLGAALFTLCQLARRLGVQAEDALREHNREFIERHRSAAH